MKRAALVLTIAVWMIAAVAGSVWLMSYARTPGGDHAASPLQWPSESAVHRAPGKPTLILLAHPHCPCTRATLNELAVLLTERPDRADVHVLFFLPEAASVEWARSDLWRSAEALPGVEVLVDRGGREAHRFGGITSGKTLLFDADGSLLFAGGITAMRGHMGDNEGRSVLTALLGGKSAERRTTPVFGCAFGAPSPGSAAPGEPVR